MSSNALICADRYASVGALAHRLRTPKDEDLLAGLLDDPMAFRALRTVEKIVRPNRAWWVSRGPRRLEPVNLLYYGDNLKGLREHIADETVDLVYLDPPFKSDQDYNVLFEEHGTKRGSTRGFRLQVELEPRSIGRAASSKEILRGAAPSLFARRGRCQYPRCP